MCGIAGIFRTGGDTTPADRAAVERMAAAETHRGPDDAGMFQDARIAVSYTHLDVYKRQAVYRALEAAVTAGTFIASYGVYH